MKRKFTPPHKLFGEDTTKYGEFVCSAFRWLPPEKQKEQAERFEKITESDKNKNKSNL